MIDYDKQFASKRNKVFLRDGRVIKIFSDSQSANAEAAILREHRNAGLSVPMVITCQDNEIVMEYIRGETIPDFLERITLSKDEAELEKAAQALCDWFVHFYKVVDHRNRKEIRGDVNGRNFLITAGGVVGIDFEERVYGAAEQDVGRLLAFIHTYNFPNDSAQRSFAMSFQNRIISLLNLSLSEIEHYYKLELTAMKERRKP